MNIKREINEKKGTLSNVHIYDIWMKYTDLIDSVLVLYDETEIEWLIILPNETDKTVKGSSTIIFFNDLIMQPHV